jgi:hypothetical protein
VASSYRFPAKALHPERQIHRESHAGLFAVADNVDPDFNLFFDDVGHRVNAQALQQLLINRLPRLFVQ